MSWKIKEIKNTIAYLDEVVSMQRAVLGAVDALKKAQNTPNIETIRRAQNQYFWNLYDSSSNPNSIHALRDRASLIGYGADVTAEILKNIQDFSSKLTRFIDIIYTCRESTKKVDSLPNVFKAVDDNKALIKEIAQMANQFKKVLNQKLTDLTQVADGADEAVKKGEDNPAQSFFGRFFRKK